MRELDEHDWERFELRLAELTRAAPETRGRRLAELRAATAESRDVLELLELHLRLRPEETALPGLGARYEVRSELGRGGMGRVLLAFDRTMEREVALKVEETTGEPVRDFEGEARLTSQLEHPNIVPVYDLGRGPAGQPFFAMRLVHGHSLAEHMARSVAGDGQLEAELPLTRRIEIVRRICDALAYAHGRGVLHRDLKPENVMLGPFGEVQVMDWGLAERRTPASSKSLESGWSTTATGELFGTPSYMAPEQAEGRREEIDARTDVFGIGAILHHLITGEPPYRGRTRDEVLERARTARRNDPELRAVRPRPPAELRAIVAKAMSSRKEDRYADPAALGADLLAYLEGTPGEAWRDGPLRRLAKRARRRPATTATALASVLIGLLAIIAWQKHVVGEERRRANEALAERNARQAEVLWDERLVRELTALRGSHGQYIKGSNDQDFVRWARDHVLVLTGLGFALAPEAGARNFEPSFAALERRRPEHAERLLRALYQLDVLLYRSRAAFVDLERRGQPPPPPQGVAAEAWRQNLATWSLGLQSAQDVVELWSPLGELLQALEWNPARRDVFRAWRRWFVDRSDALGDGHDLSTQADDRLWFAQLVRSVRGRSAALPLYEQAAELDPGSFWAHFQLAEAKYRAEADEADLRDCVQHAGIACALDPSSGWAYANAGVFSIELAVRLERQLTGAPPELSARLRTEAAELKVLGIRNYERALDLNPNIGVVYTNLANSVKEAERCAPLYLRSLELEPCVRGTFTSARERLTHHGRHEELIPILEQALACADTPEHHFWMSETLHALAVQLAESAPERSRTALERSRSELAKVRAAVPDNTDGSVLEILLELSGDEPDIGVARLEEALDELTARADPSWLSSILYLRERLERALALIGADDTAARLADYLEAAR